MKESSISALSKAIVSSSQIIFKAFAGVSKISREDIESVLIDVVGRLAANEKVEVIASGIKGKTLQYSKCADLMALAHSMYKSGDQENAVIEILSAFEAADASNLMQALADINSEFEVNATRAMQRKVRVAAKQNVTAKSATIVNRSKKNLDSMRARRKKLKASERFSEQHGKEFIEPDTSLLDFQTEGDISLPNDESMETDDMDQYINPENLTPHDLDTENRVSNVVADDHSTEEDYAQTGVPNDRDYKRFMRDPKTISESLTGQRYDHLNDDDLADDSSDDMDDDQEGPEGNYYNQDDNDGTDPDGDSNVDDEMPYNDEDSYNHDHVQNALYDEIGNDAGEQQPGNYGGGPIGFSPIHAKNKIVNANKASLSENDRRNAAKSFLRRVNDA